MALYIIGLQTPRIESALKMEALRICKEKAARVVVIMMRIGVNVQPIAGAESYFGSLPTLEILHFNGELQRDDRTMRSAASLKAIVAEQFPELRADPDTYKCDEDFATEVV